MTRAALVSFSVSFKEFRLRYSSEEACREELFRLRFPDGFVCPVCGCREYYWIRKRNLCQCRSCRHQTSVTIGTVMHRTRLPLTVWFWAIYLCATDKRVISAVQLSRVLSVCYETAWHLLNRIRSAMGQRDGKYQLSGIVELDDAYIGGNSHNLGTYHGRCTTLQPYLNEFCFRFNRRNTGDQIFLRLTRAVATSCGLLS